MRIFKLFASPIFIFSALAFLILVTPFLASNSQFFLYTHLAGIVLFMGFLFSTMVLNTVDLFKLIKAFKEKNVNEINP